MRRSISRSHRPRTRGEAAGEERTAERAAAAVEASMRSATLGLGQVELAVEEGAAGEFAGFGEAGAEFEAAGQQHLHDHRAAVALEFDDVFAGEGWGAGK